LLFSAALGGLFIGRRVKMHPHTTSMIAAAKKAPSCINCMASSVALERGRNRWGIAERAAHLSAVQSRKGEKRDWANNRPKRAQVFPSQSSRRPRSRWPNDRETIKIRQKSG
jgi:hypothetical protein